MFVLYQKNAALACAEAAASPGVAHPDLEEALAADRLGHRERSRAGDGRGRAGTRQGVQRFRRIRRVLAWILPGAGVDTFRASAIRQCTRGRRTPWCGIASNMSILIYAFEYTHLCV